jgi:hypothetical protein
MKTLRMNVGRYAIVKLQAKMCSILAVMAIAIIAIVVIGCKHDVPTPQAQPSVTIGGKTIPVYKGAGVSDANFATTVESLQGIYPLLSENARNFFKDNVTRIEIWDWNEGMGAGFTFNTGVLRVPAGATNPGMASAINSIISNIING